MAGKCPSGSVHGHFACTAYNVLTISSTRLNANTFLVVYPTRQDITLVGAPSFLDQAPFCHWGTFEGSAPGSGHHLHTRCAHPTSSRVYPRAGMFTLTFVGDVHLTVWDGACERFRILLAYLRLQ